MFGFFNTRFNLIISQYDGFSPHTRILEYGHLFLMIEKLS